MSGARYEFGRSDQVQAESVGEPGHRHFRLLISSAAGSAILWLEKEQLYALALAIHRVLATREEGSGQMEVPEDAGPGAGQPAPVEFKVGNLALGQSEDTDLISVMAYEEGADEAEDATLRWWSTPDESRQLADEALQVCASGRPRCPLCHAPLNPAEEHVCAKTNGHFSMDIEQE